MDEPIPVSLAIRAVERAIRECDAATPGPWEMGHGRVYGVGEYETNADGMFMVLARAGFRAPLSHLLVGLQMQRIGGNQVTIGSERLAVAPLISHYDATAPGWRTE